MTHTSAHRQHKGQTRKMLTNGSESNSDVVLDARDDDLRSSSFGGSWAVDGEVVLLAAERAHQTLLSWSNGRPVEDQP